ncbi:hypothetical protein [Crossiella cryophila]|uniref:Uncharacterized protein n=1 Tax=Crossiella cryophila TaxID=43355 RepID=A0A7W7C738_9PSEU|nr:hypothetical protein [Crossiella cryophila]MBB4674434.1 hypothetical protein [Crossiella cryophila]
MTDLAVPTGGLPEEQPRRPSPSHASASEATGPIADNTTRYLAAAAHLDQEFADEAIRESLAEPFRPALGVPGGDVHSVLREAVAARTRRRVRDLLLVLLVAGSIAVSTWTFLPWLAAALVWAYFASAQPTGKQRSLLREWNGLVHRDTVRKFRRLALVLLLILLAGGAATAAAHDRFTLVIRLDLLVWSLLLIVTAFLVLLIDELVLARLVGRSFQRSDFMAHPARSAWPLEVFFRHLAPPRWRRALRRAMTMRSPGNLVVHREYWPFVGSGTGFNAWSMALPLDPADESPKRPVSADSLVDPAMTPFTVSELHDHITRELAGLGEAVSLSPGARLRKLTAHDQVVASAEQLLTHLSDLRTRAVLPRLDGPPAHDVPPALVTEIRERPLEWMRHYRCFQVETWDRQLGVSVYLHIGVGERVLYLEWTPCVLLPVAEHFRAIDDQLHTFWGAVRHAAACWISLPVTIFRRAGRLTRRLRPQPHLPTRPRPAKYGAARSIRELAADENVSNYFQRRDVERYVQVLETRAFRAIGEFLTAHGISVTAFQRQANQIINLHVIRTGDVINFVGGDVSGNYVGGRDIGTVDLGGGPQ